MRKIAVIGLGYVGLPVASAFAKKQKVIAFDINEKRIAELKKGYDHTGEVSSDFLQTENFLFTSNADDLHLADFFIVAVPTPIDDAHQPDLTPLISASELIAPHLKKGDIIVYESTVYPGATEEQCLPILERYSHLKGGADFFVGYSPERINPGDKEHTFTKIKKVVSGQTKAVLKIVSEVYSGVVDAGVYEAPSIKVAEAAKVIENTQRDLNIALINELAMIFDRLGIDTQSVLEAAKTKWNFLPFKPGLVGGHCIGVDPYYLTYKAQSIGFYPHVILAGRRTNDGMGVYIAQKIIKLLSKKDRPLKHMKVGVLGITFKENCPDVRNTKVIDIIHELQAYNVSLLLHDPLADSAVVKKEYGLTLSDFSQFVDLDALVLAVAHEAYMSLPLEHIVACLNPQMKVIVDVKSVLDQERLKTLGVALWRL